MKSDWLKHILDKPIIIYKEANNLIDEISSYNMSEHNDLPDIIAYTIVSMAQDIKNFSLPGERKGK